MAGGIHRRNAKDVVIDLNVGQDCFRDVAEEEFMLPVRAPGFSPENPIRYGTR
jgi:hypothetical protein